MTTFAAAGQLTLLKNLRSEMGVHPVYVQLRGPNSGPVSTGIARLAAALLEEVIALGCRKFIACGGAGVLDQDIAPGHLLIPTWAIRMRKPASLPATVREAVAHPAAWQRLKPFCNSTWITC
ncbi:MAG: hypothetical protein U0401_14565 [Anaerolineae bacterium]